MLTIEYGALTSNFAEQSHKARMGHAVMVTRHGQPYCIVAHPSLLTEAEIASCERISSTNMYSQLGTSCLRVEREKAMFMVTAHGLARCCIVPPEFSERARAMDGDFSSP